MNTSVEAPPRICALSTRDVVDRIILFTEELSGITLYTYQSLFCRRSIESMIDNDGANITGLFARQSGKSQGVAGIAVGLAIMLPALHKEFPDDPRFRSYARGFWVGIYAPVKEQAEIVFGRVRACLTGERAAAILSDPEINLWITTDRADTLALSNGSIIMARSASPDTNIEGKTWHMLVLEEAQKLLRSKVEKDLSPMLSSTNGTTITIGTAWESRGGFHHSIQTNQEIYANGGPRNHFEFPYDIVIAEKQRAYDRDKNPYHLNYGNYINTQIKKLGGIDNDEFKMNYRCLWQENRVIAVRESIFRAAAMKDLDAGPSFYGFQVAGLDIGKISDSTVLTVMAVNHAKPIRNYSVLPEADEDKQVYYEKIIIDWLELGGSFEGSSGQYSRLVDYLLKTAIKVLCIDCTAMGDPVFERIEAMVGGTISCVPYRFTSMSKVMLYKYYLQELHAGRVKYAGSAATLERFEYGKFVSEHLDLDKSQRGGYATYEAPEGGHDDYPDSAALAAWAEKVAEDCVMPEIVSSVGPGFSGGNVSRRVRNQREEEAKSEGKGMSALEMGAIHTTSSRGDRYRSRW